MHRRLSIGLVSDVLPITCHLCSGGGGWKSGWEGKGETAIIQFYEVGRGCTSRGSKIEQEEEEEEELFFRSFSLSLH